MSECEFSDCGDPLDAGHRVGFLGGEFCKANGCVAEEFVPAKATETGA